MGCFCCWPIHFSALWRIALRCKGIVVFAYQQVLHSFKTATKSVLMYFYLSTFSAPIIAANKWHHIVGTYDAHSGIAKVFVNGRLKAEAAGNGFLSQDWNAHAGIGKHKDARFLQGEVDEFRIYNKALTQKEINDLIKKCSFQRGE